MKRKISFLTSFLNPIDRILDKTLFFILENYRIDEFKSDCYRLNIKFISKDEKKKTVIMFAGWNANKWYSWLNSGEIVNERFTYKWENSRPSRKTMNLLLEKINDYSETQFHIIKY